MRVGDGEKENVRVVIDMCSMSLVHVFINQKIPLEISCVLI